MSNQLMVDAARRLLLIREAPESFLGFIRAVYPEFKLAPFHLELIETLDALEKQTLGHRNVLITMPPRHGKSTMATVAFPAYYMLRKATRKILSVSYGSDLAQNFGRQVRDMTMEAIVAQAFPNFSLSPTSTAIDDWRTTDGGAYFACGVNGGTTGRAANLLLVDDPFKSRPQAESVAERNKVGQYYNSALVNRKEPELDGTLPIEILIQTRWHPDDLAGRIMDSEDWADGDWHHVDFPALRTETRTISVPGKPDETVTEEHALWPERFPVDMLDKMRRRDPRDFAALYQQQPYIQGGNLIRTQWFQIYDRVNTPTRFHTLIMCADTAFKAKQQNDPSVLMVLGLTATGDIYVLDVIRERLDFPALKRKFLMENAKWRGKGLRGIYIEDKASGQSILQDLRREPGMAVIPYKYAGGRDSSDKVARVNSVLPLIEGGRVYIPDDAAWLETFLEEVQSFPASKHDDQVDALAMGLDVLSRVGINQSFSSGMPDISQSLNQMGNIQQMLSPGLATRDTDSRDPVKNWLNFKPLGEL